MGQCLDAAISLTRVSSRSPTSSLHSRTAAANSPKTPPLASLATHTPAPSGVSEAISLTRAACCLLRPALSAISRTVAGRSRLNSVDFNAAATVAATASRSPDALEPAPGDEVVEAVLPAQRRGRSRLAPRRRCRHSSVAGLVGAHNSVVGTDQGSRAPSWDRGSVRDSVHEDSASAPIAAGQRPRQSFRHP